MLLSSSRLLNHHSSWIDRLVVLVMVWICLVGSTVPVVCGFAPLRPHTSLSTKTTTTTTTTTTTVLQVAIDTSDIKNGLTVEIDGEPHKVQNVYTICIWCNMFYFCFCCCLFVLLFVLLLLFWLALLLYGIFLYVLWMLVVTTHTHVCLWLGLFFSLSIGKTCFCFCFSLLFGLS